MSAYRTAEDILEEIAGVGAWANRGTWWCPGCKQYVGCKRSGGRGWHQSLCECCDKMMADEDGDWRAEWNTQRIDRIVEEYFEHPTGDTDEPI